MAKCGWCGHAAPRPCAVYEKRACPLGCEGVKANCSCTNRGHSGISYSWNHKKWLRCNECGGNGTLACPQCDNSSGTKKVFKEYCRNSQSAHSTDYVKYPLDKCNSISYNAWMKNRMKAK